MRNKIRIKQIVIIMFLLCIAILAFYSYKNHRMPVPAFPLQRQALEDALSESGLAWNVAEEEILKDGHILYTLNNSQGQPSTFVSSVESSDKRILQINFLTSKGSQSNIPQEDWGKAVSFATILYGGFQNQTQVYDNFRQTCDEKAVIDDVPGALSEFRERIRWENELNGVTCFLGFGVCQKGGGLPEAELVNITFSETKD